VGQLRASRSQPASEEVLPRLTKVAGLGLFIAASLLGCASPTYDFRGDWTADEKTAVMNGISEWPASPEHVRLVRVTDDNPDPEQCNESVDVTPTMLGTTYKDDQEICFWADRIARSANEHQMAREDLLQQTAAHETGHLFGLAHSPDNAPPSIMRAERADATLTVTNFDLATLKNYQSAQ
jgi:hypothetical protein